MLEILLPDINHITDQDRRKFRRLHYMKIKAVSQRESEKGAALIDGKWIPKSQLRYDKEGHLWISTWMYNKL